MAGRILVVDDDPEVRRGLQELLTLVPDCQVEVAQGVQEGRARAREGPWDIVLSDEQMPDGRGSELLGELSRERPESHYVLMSGFADFDQLLRGVHAHHIDHFIQKPYDPGHLLEWVQRTLRERTQVGGRLVRPSLFRRVGGEGQERPPSVVYAVPRQEAAKAGPRPALQPPAAPPPQAPVAAPPPPSAAAALLGALGRKPEPPQPDAVLAALRRTVDEGLQDVALLLRWAREASRPDEKLKHVRMAQRRMEDTARNLEALAGGR